MYIILVDDEQIILNGVERFLKRKWPDLDIDTFSNGFDALDSMQKRMPALLITDISMPEMDGIELVEKAVALGLENSVMLTGYDEFSLAQKALRLHALDYLLKPVDKEQLYQLVEKVMAQEAQKLESERETTRIGLRLCCLYGAEPSDLITTPNAQLAFAGQPLVLLLLLDEKALIPSELDPLRALTGEPVDLGQDNNGSAVRLYPVSGEQRQQVIAAAKALNTRPYFRGMAVVPAVLSQLHAAYAQALEGTESGLQQAILAYINRADDLSPTLLALDSLFYRRGLFADRMAMIDRFLSAVNCRQDVWNLAKLLSLYPQKSEGERRRLLGEWLDTLTLAPRMKSREALQGLDYIDQHYRENLSLTQVAQQVFLPPSYFSTLFHKETGMTFVEYINHSRINDACRAILSGREDAIETIAAECGYENPHYFFKVFKNYTGMTPSALRQLSQ